MRPTGQGSDRSLARSVHGRGGIALAAVLTATVVALWVWAGGYQRFSSLINLEARLEWGSVGSRPPDLGSALGRVVACFRTALPPASPYSCQLSLGRGSNLATFTVQYVDQGSGRWRAVLSPGANPADPACPDCPTAVGP